MKTAARAFVTGRRVNVSAESVNAWLPLILTITRHSHCCGARGHSGMGIADCSGERTSHDGDQTPNSGLRHPWFKQSLFINRNHKLNKQQVQHKSNMLIAVLPIKENTVTYSFTMARSTFKLLSKVKGNKTKTRNNNTEDF